MRYALLIVVAFLLSRFSVTPVTAEEQIRTLTFSQSPCLIKEFEPQKAEIKATTAAECPEGHGTIPITPLIVKSGQYDIIVQNDSVPWDVGIWLRAKNPKNRVLLPNLALNNMSMGQMTKRQITLPAGRYLVSSLLNNTPNYTLIVEP